MKIHRYLWTGPYVGNNVNTIWETWKNNIDITANHIIGKHRKVENYEKFWDKELEGLIKSRQASPLLDHYN
jgi:hypothetical protein